MDETLFEDLAEETLTRIAETIEEADGDAVLEVELTTSVLTITTPDGGEYVINKHSPTCQIWVSSPESGATHFVYDEDDEVWRSTRGGVRLEELLSEELGAHIDGSLEF